MQFQLGVNTRGGDGLMTQDIRYLFEARTSIHHVGGGRMAEDMAGDSRKDDDAGMLTGLASCKAYAKDVAERCEAPPEPLRLGGRLLDSYGLAAMMETA